MKTVYETLIIVLLTAGALFIDIALGNGQSEPYNQPVRPISHPLLPPHLSTPTIDTAAGSDVNGQPVMRATKRISIPFGIAPVLPLHDGGESVIVRGHGGCTAGESVSVVVTVTQATGAIAVGQTEESCTGILQQWTLTATAAAALDAGSAEACGLAVTRSDGSVTDSFDWCRDVALTWRHYYLSIIRTGP